MSTLKAVMETISEADAPLSLGFIAHTLKITPEKAESMIEFWIRRGHIKVLEGEADCGSCGINGECPFVNQLPTLYEAVSPEMA